MTLDSSKMLGPPNDYKESSSNQYSVLNSALTTCWISGIKERQDNGIYIRPALLQVEKVDYLSDSILALKRRDGTIHYREVPEELRVRLKTWIENPAAEVIKTVIKAAIDYPEHLSTTHSVKYLSKDAMLNYCKRTIKIIRYDGTYYTFGSSGKVLQLAQHTPPLTVIHMPLLPKPSEEDKKQAVTENDFWNKFVGNYEKANSLTLELITKAKTARAIPTENGTTKIYYKNSEAFKAAPEIVQDMAIEMYHSIMKERFESLVKSPAAKS